ncbi:MFS transporter [Sphaerisporangium dianthi]|uniref:MFS transporter n=1 Tax=Sphaerisporangium dianthi TaxID=1436120 RepID=A0ABV9CIP7_9ACTN
MPLGTRRASVVLANVAFVLVGVSAGVGGVLLPSQIADYRVDNATIGITFFTFSAGFMLAGITAGALIQRLGIRMALAVGCGAYVLAALYTATRPPFLALVAVQVVAGYGTGVLEAALNTYLTRLPNATTLLNRLHAFFGVGALLGPLMAAWILTLAPWPAVWLALALLALPLAAGFLTIYPRDDVPAPRDTAHRGRTPQDGTSSDQPSHAAADSAAAHGPEPAGRGLLASALRSPAVLLASLLLAVYVGLELGVGNWGFTYLVEEQAQPSLIAGYVISGYWLGLTLGRFLVSPAAARVGLGAAGMVYACLAGVTATAVLTWLAPVPAVAAAGFVLLGFFLGPIFPTVMAMVPRLTSARLVPTVIGVTNGVSLIGGAVFPWLAGTLAQGVGMWTLMLFAVILGLLQLVMWRSVAARMAAEPVPDAARL